MRSVKPWYQSKTVWSTIITALLGLYESLRGMSGVDLPPLPSEVFIALGVLGVYGRTTAKERLN